MVFISTMTVTPILLHAAIAAPSTVPYPIEPVPLRVLCDEADLIVRARVEQVAPFEGSSSESPMHRFSTATLFVDSVLKGTPNSGGLLVSFEAQAVCPAPARYTEDSSVLAFLRWSERHSKYFTTGLSYGLKELDEEGYQVYADSIWKYFEIRSRDLEQPEEDALILDWLVELAEDPITRWEGAFELGPEPDPGWPPRSGAEEVPEYIGRLTEGHVQRLRRALYAEDEVLAQGNRCLVRALSALGDPDLPLFLFQFLKEYDFDVDRGERFWLPELMLIVARMKTKAQAVTITEDFDEALLGSSLDSEEETIARKRRCEALFQEYLRVMSNCRWP